MQAHEAIRVPSFQPEKEKEEEVLVTVKNVLQLESLERGPVPPSGPSGCTYGANSNGPPCVNNKKYAGRAMAPPRRDGYRPVAPATVSVNRK
ncbi:hypothetical protein JCGZ_21808 [Jatropha curcas]|uniref:Uncharacterized protein n=1 Tax=Jatropha curcas TaxID=180498 RepID=A0A067JC12_JATCU|nr:hypothetical protein JCGZ_21808 [Jatropha curcas]